MSILFIMEIVNSATGLKLHHVKNIIVFLIFELREIQNTLGS